MAIANADGSIILTTKVDDSGINDFFRKYKTELGGIGKQIKENTKSTEDFGQKSRESSEKSKKGFEGLKETLKGVGSALSAAFAVQKIIQFSNESASLATQTEASVQRLVDIYGSASDGVGDFINQNARALGMSKAAAASFSSVYGNLFSVWADQSTNAELTNRYLNMTAVVASKTGRTVEDVQERIRSGLLGNTEAIEDLGVFVNVKTIEMTDAFKRMANGKSWEQLDAYTQQQIRSMAILEQATAKYGDEVADTSATMRNRYKAAYEDFQNSWGNIVNTVLLPVLETLTQIFDIATKGLNALSGRSGQILENVELQEENTDKTSENIEEQTKNQKELNKELKKATASFDDIEILSANAADNTSGGLDSGLQGIGGGLGGTAPDGSAYVEEINGTLTAIMGIVALSLVAVGLILMFTGNIGWGAGFIIAGAATLTVTMASASEFGYDGIIQMLTTIMGVAGGALLALGIILVYFKILPTGIGMIVAGASLIVSSVAMQGIFNPDDIASWLSIIMGIAGGALLAIGIFLCYMKVYPQGIGLIIAGATSLISAVALGSEDITEKIKGWVAVIMAIAGASLLVLGIILCATGAGIATGIALIAAGAVALVTPIALNFNAIVDWVKGAWDAVKDFWNKYIAPVFTTKFWLDLAKACGNGLIAGFEGAINGIIRMFEAMINMVVGGLNKISISLPNWKILGDLKGKKFGINIPKAKFNRVSIPRLAQGTVIPPNREFLAVLGDNKRENEIVSPVSTMKQAFMEAMVEMGGNYGGGNTEVVLEIDGREFGRAVVEQGNRENRRIGTRLVIA